MPQGLIGFQVPASRASDRVPQVASQVSWVVPQVSSEIKTLQERAGGLSLRTRNRRAAESSLAAFVDGAILVPPWTS